MPDAASQLLLFGNSTSSSPTDVPNSQASNALETSSIEQSPSIPSDATSTARESPAVASFTLGGVDGAGMSSVDASSTAESELLPTSSTSISPFTEDPTFAAPRPKKRERSSKKKRKHSKAQALLIAAKADPMLAIPRPLTRADCRAEARPCPWVGCRHHLLISVVKPKPKTQEERATSLRLNRASPGKTNPEGGRRPGLRSSAASEIVRQWIDDAVELLSYMPYTCALDVVEAFPDGLSPRQVGWLFGVTEQVIDAECRKPHMREALRHLRDYLSSD